MTPIETWSTNAVPRKARLDYFAEALSSAIVPMRVEPTCHKSISSHMSMLDVDGIAVLQQKGSQHRSIRTVLEISRSEARTFHLIVNRSSHWCVNHAGTRRVERGQAFLIDSGRPDVIEMPSDYDVIHIMFPEAWLRRWLHDIESIVGRPLGMGTGDRDNALAAFAAHLSPFVLQRSAVSSKQMVEHLGGLLTLCHEEIHQGGGSGPIASLSEQIAAYIAGQCGKRDLSVDDVAREFSIDDREVHHALVCTGRTFTSLLIQKRADAAQRMIAARAFGHLTFDEIARRAGFNSVSDMSRVLGFTEHLKND